MKPLRAEDLVIGGKYVPHTKSVWQKLEHSFHWSEAQKKGQPFLFFIGIDDDGDCRFSVDKNSNLCDYFHPSDVTEYQN